MATRPQQINNLLAGLNFTVENDEYEMIESEDGEIRIYTLNVDFGSNKKGNFSIQAKTLDVALEAIEAFAQQVKGLDQAAFDEFKQGISDNPLAFSIREKQIFETEEIPGRPWLPFRMNQRTVQKDVDEVLFLTKPHRLGEIFDFVFYKSSRSKNIELNDASGQKVLLGYERAKKIGANAINNVEAYADYLRNVSTRPVRTEIQLTQEREVPAAVEFHLREEGPAPAAIEFNFAEEENQTADWF